MGFQVFYSKVLSYELKATAFAQAKDVIALHTDEDTIIIKRVAQKPQRIAVVEEVLKPRSMNLEKDGELLAIGSEEGVLKVYQVLSNHTDLLCQLPLFATALRHLQWTSSSTLKIGDFPETERLIPSANSASSVMKHTASAGNVSVLLAADATTASLLMDGVIQFATLDLEASFGSPLEIRSVLLSPDFWELHALVEGPEGLEWGVLDCSLLAIRTGELQRLCHLNSNISELLKFLTRSFRSLLKDWGVLANFFKSRFVLSLEDHLVSCGAKTPARDVLFHCCATGLMATGLTHFLREEVHSSKVLVQFEEKLRLLVKNFQVSTIEALLHPAEKLAHYCSQLKACSLDQQKYGVFGVQSSHYDQLMGLSAALFSQANMILSQSSKAHKSVHNFLVWVHYLAFKHGKLEEGAEPNLFTDAALDVALLLEFLESPQAFSLDTVKLSLSDRSSVDVPSDLSFVPSPAPVASVEYLLGRLEIELKGVTKSIQSHIPQYIQVKSRQLLTRQTDSASLTQVGEATIALIVSQGSNILLTKQLGGQCFYTSYSVEGTIATAFMHGSDSLLVLTVGEGSTELMLGTVEAGDWSSTPGIAKALAVKKRLAFEGEELTIAEANSGRGLLSLVLNDRHLKLIDLEDSS